MWFTREIVSEKSVLGVVFIVLLEWSNRQNDMRHGCAVRKAMQSRKKLYLKEKEEEKHWKNDDRQVGCSLFKQETH